MITKDRRHLSPRARRRSIFDPAMQSGSGLVESMRVGQLEESGLDGVFGFVPVGAVLEAEESARATARAIVNEQGADAKEIAGAAHCQASQDAPHGGALAPAMRRLARRSRRKFSIRRCCSVGTTG